MSSEKIEQNWKVQIVNDNPTFPFVVIDNWFTPDEEKTVWKELDFFSAIPKEQIDRAENTIVARGRDGIAKSNAYRFYIEDFYKKREVSPILNGMYKQKTPQFHKIIKDNCMPHARSFLSSNNDSSLISYYEENDHYKPHHDTFLWTCLIWMVREPRLFNGGDFKLNEPDVEVKLHTQPKELGYGRYTITHFYFTIPAG